MIDFRLGKVVIRGQAVGYLHRGTPYTFEKICMVSDLTIAERKKLHLPVKDQPKPEPKPEPEAQNAASKPKPEPKPEPEAQNAASKPKPEPKPEPKIQEEPKEEKQQEKKSKK